MAEIAVDGPDVVVRLSRLERLGAMRGDIRFPRAAIASCRVSTDPWSELRGMRAPGTGWPGLISLCTRRGEGFRDFAAVYRKRPAVVIELRDAEFDRLVICVKHLAFAEEIASHLKRSDTDPALSG
jgi:hypothetical protein